MLFENLQNIDLNKIAIINDGKRFSYSQILGVIKNRALFFKNSCDTFLLCHNDDFENFLNFLAAMAAGRKVVFGGKSIEKEHQSFYAQKFNLKILDFVPEINGEIEFFHQPHSKEFFLGILSSGSSGMPKIIWKDYQSWFSAFPHQSSVFGVSEADNVFVINALAYSANLNTALHTIWMGATLVLGKLSDASKWSSQMEKLEVTATFLVPSHIRLLLENRNLKLQNLKSLVSAGEKLSAHLSQKILNTFPNVLLTEYYGAAELGHISYAQNKDILEKPTSVGITFPGVQISIIDGKIWVESNYVSPEYRNKPSVSDFGYLDEGGFLFLLGREGRMFNRRGLNIFAEEIENSALEHPLVLEALAIASREKEDGILLYVVVSRPVPKSELRLFLLQKLPKQKLPNQILFTENLPRSNSGKVNFKVLSKRPVEEELEN